MSYKPFIIILFWICGAIPFIAFLFYPVFIRLFSIIKRPISAPRSSAAPPQIALLFAAFNEENVIRQKIENSLSLDYPKDKLRIIIHTDGSTDNTDSIVSEYVNQGVLHLRDSRNRGKTCALNNAARAAKSPILVFSDANSMYHRDALRKLSRWMSLKDVGCVCGRLIYKKTAEHRAEKGEKKYWEWDTRLKLQEGRSGHLLGANGAIFALKSELAITLPGNQSNDMILPIIARLHGFNAIYDPEAVAVEETAKSVRGEYRRKARIIARGLNGVVFAVKCAMLKKGETSSSSGSRIFILFQLFCKKLFRYLSFPAILLMMCLGLLASPGMTFAVTLALWGALAFCVIMTLAAPVVKKYISPCPDFSYLLAIAWAGCVGFWIFITGKTMSQWKSYR